MSYETVDCPKCRFPLGISFGKDKTYLVCYDCEWEKDIGNYTETDYMNNEPLPEIKDKEGEDE